MNEQRTPSPAPRRTPTIDEVRARAAATPPEYVGTSWPPGNGDPLAIIRPRARRSVRVDHRLSDIRPPWPFRVPGGPA